MCQKPAAHKARQEAFLGRLTVPGQTGVPLGLIVAELKETSPSRLGARFIFKHAPEFSAVADGELFERFGKVFEEQLTLAELVPESKIIAIASFIPHQRGYVALEQIGLMLVTKDWLPFESMKEAELLNELVAQKRSFSKQLRYNLKPKALISSAVLTDCDPATALFVVAGADGAERAEQERLISETDFASWVWREGEVMPALPAKTERGAL